VELYDQFEHTIDGKGRLVLPAPYRPAFAEGGFLVFLGRYAALFSPDEWERYRNRLERSGEFDRELFQYVLSFVTPFQPDSQNRIGIPTRLRQRVGLDREVTIVGSGSHAAIYPRDVWAALENRVEAAPDGRTIEDRFASLGFL
jgi:MraZ protein